MDLIDQIRTTRETDHLASISHTTLADVSQLGTSIDVHGAIAVNGYKNQMVKILQNASNSELLAAYQHSSGMLAPLEIDAVIAEIRRRSIEI